MKLKNLIWLLEGREWDVVEGNRGLDQADFVYQCDEWRRARRFVAVRQLISAEKGLFDITMCEYFCYVTTERLNPIEVYRSHGNRATCETWTEKCKNQTKMGHVRTCAFFS